VSVAITEPADQVIYYEGDETVTFHDLTLNVTDPAGDVVTTQRYDGTLAYEKLDLTKGRALATFRADERLIPNAASGSRGRIELEPALVAPSRCWVRAEAPHRQVQRH
jgi:hypothetical protein